MSLATVKREMWESYQAHFGEGCIDRRLLLRWYEMVSREMETRERERERECGETT